MEERTIQELINYCSDDTGCSEDEVRRVIDVFLDKITCELSQGNTVDLGNDFGSFFVRLRSGIDNLKEHSPRLPKDSRYKVFFREKSGMKKRMKL
ncbi:MAG: HU family DNA-binding protein [Anaerovoracaceae bacterium]